jgi:hypothetical protein
MQTVYFTEWNPAVVREVIIASGTMEKIGGFVAERARSLAPVGATGHLRDSIHVDKDPGDAMGVTVRTKWYGRFLELPAKQIHHAQHFLTTAIRDLNGRKFYI